MSLFLKSASAAKLEALSKAMAIIEFKLDGTIVTANENFLATVGYSLDEIKGRHHSLFVEPAYGASTDYRDFWASLNRGENKVAEFKRVAKGGREIWLEASYNPILGANGKPVSVVKFATDITKRQEQNMALADAAKCFEAGIKSAVESVSSSASDMQETAHSLASTAHAIQSITNVISQVSHISVSVSGAVEQQAAATREVSLNISGVNQAAGHTGSASVSLLNLADLVTRQVAGLGARVDNFLQSIHAAA